MVIPRTLEEIRLRGLEALRRELGRAGLVRFLQQFSAGQGDYSRARHGWVDRTALQDLRAAAKKRSDGTQAKRMS
jgi:hypothetical protein